MRLPLMNYQHVLNVMDCIDLHEGPAEERNQDHWQPRGHLGEAPGHVAVRNSQSKLLELTVEGVEETLVRRDIRNLVVDNQSLVGLGGSASAVQGLVADDWDGRRLVCQRLGDREQVQRWCADRPRVAENVLLLTVKVRKLGRVRLCSHDGKRCLF